MKNVEMLNGSEIKSFPVYEKTRIVCWNSKITLETVSSPPENRFMYKMNLSIEAGGNLAIVKRIEFHSITYSILFLMYNPYWFAFGIVLR